MSQPSSAGRVWGWARTIAMLAILGAVFAGCATTVPDARTMKPEDLKLIVGEWRGTANVQGQQPVAIQGTIYENGTFNTAPRATPANTQAGVLRIVDGKVLYQSAASEGTMTFHEDSAGWTWKWQGKTRDGSAVTSVLTKNK